MTCFVCGSNDAPYCIHADHVPMSFCSRHMASFFNELEEAGEACPRCKIVYKDLWWAAERTRFVEPITITAPSLPHTKGCRLAP